MPPPPAQRAATVRRLSERLGFAMLGIAPADAADHADHVKQWLAAGRHGEMTYMEAALAERLDPRRLVPGAKSIICVADLYADRAAPEPPLPPAPAGRIARYAWGDDYHKVMKKRLHRLADDLREVWPDEEYRTTVDTAPILEREQALRAGLGWVGKNTMLIHPRLGSYMLLGEIVTTLALETAGDAGQAISDHCGTCTRCIDACPTRCIDPAGYTLDASRCISYLTLEHRGPIAPELHAPIGDWLAGCDVCQEVCPFNAPLDAPPPAAIHPAHRPRPPAPAIPILDLLQWDADARREAFERSALKRIRLDQLKRNALIIAGNYLGVATGHPDPALLARVRAIANDPDETELVRTTARQVLERME
ncbi:MAG: tRNA epoxyqueuosine(34) reductase QueG [Planctomycetes bacterium]|nr:tRNA epoxyqueuosine(34) reductase QueG [Planctomycetota bacterium]